MKILLLHMVACSASLVDAQLLDLDLPTADERILEQLEEQNRILRQQECDRVTEEIRRDLARQRDDRLNDTRLEEMIALRVKIKEAEIKKRQAAELAEKLAVLKNDRKVLLESMAAAEKEIREHGDNRAGLVRWVHAAKRLSDSGDIVFSEFSARIDAIYKTVPNPQEFQLIIEKKIVRALLHDVEKALLEGPLSDEWVSFLESSRKSGEEGDPANSFYLKLIVELQAKNEALKK